MIKSIVRLFRYLFAIYIALVFFFCLYSFGDTGINLSEYIFGIRADRVAHFIMFFPYPISAWLALKGSLRKLFPEFPQIIVLLSGFGLAFIAETLQKLNPARESDLFDLAANFIAIISGTVVIFVFRKFIDNVWPDRLQ